MSAPPGRPLIDETAYSRETGDKRPTGLRAVDTNDITDDVFVRRRENHSILNPKPEIVL